MSLLAYTTNVEIATGSARIVAAVPFHDVDPYGPGYVEVAAFDRASGELAWRTPLRTDPFESQSQVSVSPPIVDSAGNVIAWMGMFAACGEFECPKRSLFKLAAADGSVLWRVDDNLYTGILAKPILALGDDVLVYGPFDGSNATLRRYSGVDGSLQWESDVFASDGVANVYRSGSQLIVFPASFGALQWSALDMATGALAWNGTALCDPNANCRGNDGIALSGGGIVLPMQPGENASLVEVATDGSGTSQSWPLAPAAPNLYTTLWGLDEESDGTIGFALQRYGNALGSGVWAGRFDASAPANISYQRVDGMPLGAVASGKLALDSLTFDAGPTHSRYSLQDIAVTATGNLAVSFSVDHDLISAGDYLGFRIVVTYTGDAALFGANVRSRMRWPSGAIDLACAGNGVSNCVIDTSIHNVDATFDIEPGGTLNLTGRILVLDFYAGESGVMGARVVGPLGLNESDTTDNFASATFVQALFAHGFDD